MKKIALVTLIACSSLTAKAEGLDLTPALFGCIMSGGECFLSTGLPFVDAFFGKGVTSPAHNDESFCRNYIGSWCDGHVGGYTSGYEHCREAKKMMYKTAKVKMNDWHPPKGQIPGTSNEWTETIYFHHLEQQLSKRGEALYFTCTPRQQYIWLKSRCGHTRAYATFWSHDAMNKDHGSRWPLFKTETCGEK